MNEQTRELTKDEKRVFRKLGQIPSDFAALPEGWSYYIGKHGLLKIRPVKCVNAAEQGVVDALRGLVAEVHLSKLNIRKDFSLINAHAAATKALIAWKEAK